MVRRIRGHVLAPLAVLLMCLVIPGTASADPDASARARLDTLARRVDEAEARDNVLTDRVVALDRSLARVERELAAIRRRFGGRASAMYQTGVGADPIVVMLSTADPSSVIGRLDLLAAANRSDEDVMRRGAVLARQLRDQRRAVDATRREAAEAAKAFEKDVVELRALLDRMARAERVRAKPRASRAARLSGRYACLVGSVRTYRDTWGAPRSGGRRHKGTDVMAPWGSPAYAVTSGVVRRESWSSNGGHQLYLGGDDGNEYFYAHLSSYLARSGQRVTAGEEIAKVGDSGNAEGTPHVHFEVHPGGGAPVNPYPYVRRFCG